MLLMQILIKLIINKLHLKTVMVEKSEPEKKTVAEEEQEVTWKPLVVQTVAVKEPNEKATTTTSIDD